MTPELSPSTSKPRSPWIPLLVAVIVFPFSAYGVFWGLFFVLGDLSEGWHSASFGDSSFARVIVFTPDDAGNGFAVELVPVVYTEHYTETHPRSTFLIPTERTKDVQQRLQDDLKLHWNDFDIKRISDHEEEIVIFFMDRTDDSFGSRYRATNDHVKLESYRYISDRGGIGVLLAAFVGTAVLHLLVIGGLLARAIYLWRKRARLSRIE